ncbi:MAG TPA: bifunctional pyr operon transcriptional regulator/uracil phosphoribosyltransferase PyrR [Chthoniobacteraceae bacterium]|jgi:pyrimidine operon attenuation protein/uracil phosphoribosyltransferase
MHDQPPVPDATLLLDAQAIERALRRIAHEIIERNSDLHQVALIGIPSRGVELARRLAAFVEQIEKVPLEHGAIDVAMHRDDLHLRRRLAAVAATRLPLQLDGATIVLVDDVAFTGRTCRAAMDALSSFGRPARIQFAALVDRGHRELPIRPDYVGKNLPTSRSERVFVRLKNVDEIAADGVWLAKSPEAR